MIAHAYFGPDTAALQSWLNIPYFFLEKGGYLLNSGCVPGAQNLNNGDTVQEAFCGFTKCFYI